MANRIRATVLLMTRSTYTRLYLEKFLTPMMVESHTVRTVAELATQFSLLKPRLVIIDCDSIQPGTAAFSTLKDMRSVVPQALIIALTAAPTVRFVEEAIKASVEDVIVRPCTDERLIESLQRSLPPPVVRQHLREKIELQVQVRFDCFGARFYPACIEDVSRGGVRLALITQLNQGDPGIGSIGYLEIDLQDRGPSIGIKGMVVRTISQGRMGIEFQDVTAATQKRIEVLLGRVNERKSRQRDWLNEATRAPDSQAAALPKRASKEFESALTTSHRLIESPLGLRYSSANRRFRRSPRP